MLVVVAVLKERVPEFSQPSGKEDLWERRRTATRNRADSWSNSISTCHKGL